MITVLATYFSILFILIFSVYGEEEHNILAVEMKNVPDLYEKYLEVFNKKYESRHELLLHFDAFHRNLEHMLHSLQFTELSDFVSEESKAKAKLELTTTEGDPDENNQETAEVFDDENEVLTLGMKNTPEVYEKYLDNFHKKYKSQYELLLHYAFFVNKVKMILDKLKFDKLSDSFDTSKETEKRNRKK